MDIFYYWKDYEQDIKEPGQTIGRFVSGQRKFEKLNSCEPKYIWAFKTPKGYKGRVQLIARLLWSRKDVVKLPPSKRTGINSMTFYDPEAKDSVIYTNTNSDPAISHVTKLVGDQFPDAVSNNFIGAIEAMEDSFLEHFNREIARYSYELFWPVRPSVLKKK